MFLGHYALGLAGKKVAPELSLGALFFATQFADLLWPTLVLAGVEKLEIRPGTTAVNPLDFVDYPWSHSLLALGAWGLLVALGYVAVRVLRGGRASALAGATLGGLVVSHWLLDFASHRPDLPLAFGSSPKLGLGLWGSLPATVAVELALLAAGVVFYLRATVARDRTGEWAFWGLVVFLLVIHFASLFGPPPPSARAVALSAEALWLTVFWGAWIDRHRAPRAAPEGGRVPAVNRPTAA
jgi:hypothetical protein